jgi:adenine/guanine phosphoribosyltransferase-like PRPP-binding protein
MLSINGPLRLADYPEGLAQLLAPPASPTPSPGRTLEIALSSHWFDLSLLSILALGLARLKRRRMPTLIKYPSATHSKMAFLWRSFFWPIVGPNSEDSLISVDPNPWHFRPPSQYAPLNHTPLLLHEFYSHGLDVKTAVDAWDHHLRATVLAKAVADADLMISKEYLYLVLWELVQNVQDHAAAEAFVISGQLFLSPTDAATLPSGYGPDVVQEIKKSYDRDIQHSSLHLRRRWLSDHRDTSLLLISCVDDGLGIPQTLRKRHSGSDSTLIRRAFTEDTSSKSARDTSLFDAHGLTQVGRLVTEYGGYLFVQSGNGYCEMVANETETTSIRNAFRLPGTIVQVLLPVSSSSMRSRNTTFAFREMDAHQLRDKPSCISVAKVLGIPILKHVPEESEWRSASEPLIQKVREWSGPRLFVDFTCVPRNRQFVSYLLRRLKRERLLDALVITNVEPELFSVLHSLHRLAETLQLSASELSEPLKDVPFSELDREMRSALSRGEEGWALPLLVPIAIVRPQDQLASVTWLGLPKGETSLGEALRVILDHLLRTNEPLSINEIPELLSQSNLGRDDGRHLITSLHSVARVNRGLLQITDGQIHLGFDIHDLYVQTFLSKRDFLEEALLPEALHRPAGPQRNFIYSFSWREPNQRFRNRYYQMWSILADTISLEICARLLVEGAFTIIGEDLIKLQAVVSVTATAGLLGRRVSEILDMPFYEVSSIYELRRPDAFPFEPNGGVLIVDDVLDSGALTKAIISRVRELGVERYAVACLVRTTDGGSSLSCPVFSGSMVALGRPSQALVRSAVPAQRYFEVDPHTLKPIAPRSYLPSGDSLNERRLRALCDANAVFTGHFIFHEHHYETLFSLPHLLMGPTKDDLIGWMESALEGFCEAVSAKSITVLYPYYSPVYLLVRLLESAGFSLSRGTIKVRFLVAKPTERSGGRMGYIIECPPEWETLETFDACAFLDDGISTGGTLASIVEALSERGTRALMAMVVFDRIGLHPRRTLRGLREFETNKEGRAMAFSFKSYVSVNSYSFFRSTCPDCALLERLQRLPQRTGLMTSFTASIERILSPESVATCRGQVRSEIFGEEQLRVIAFRDAVFSDVPSSLEIRRSLWAKGKGRSAKARLMMLHTVLSDRKLDRQLLERDDIGKKIATDCVELGADDGFRAKFILKSLQWCDRKLFVRFVTEILPDVYGQLIDSSHTQLGSIDLFFDERPLEFAAVYRVIEVERDALRSACSSPLDKWPFARQEHGYPYASVYHFELSLLFEERSGTDVERAKLLVVNFRGSFPKRHSEALQQVCLHFEAALRDGYLELARKRLPEPVLDLLVDAVDHTQKLFLLDHDSSRDLLTMRRNYRALSEQSDLRDFARLFGACFINTDSIVERVITAITPTIDDILRQAKHQFLKAIPEEVRRGFRDFSNELMFTGVQLLGNGEFLARTIAHLLKNPFHRRFGHHFRNRRMGSGGRRRAGVTSPPFGVELFVTLDDMASTVRVAVTDENTEMTESEIEQAFFKGGGLMSQRPQMRRWGGDLVGGKLVDGRNEFAIVIPIALRSSQP